MNKYLEELNNKSQAIEFNDLLEYAFLHNIPIVKKESLVLILTILSLIDAKKILEIGTAIGYSGIRMVYGTNRILDTIERNSEMVAIARANIQKYQLDQQIKVHHEDALLLDINQLNGPYDVIFIDAAKAQNIKFFEKYQPLLSQNGCIITDNIIFHGLVNCQEGISKNVKNLISKINEYNLFLANHTNFQTSFINIGDGLAISSRKKS